MGSTDLDRIIASEPINRTAAQVMRRGVHWEKTLDAHEVRSDIPLPTKPVYPGEFDLTGKVYGRLRVIGLGIKQGKQAVWVCRCICGHYCHKKARILRQPDQSRLMCQRCDHVDQLKTYSGKWPDRTPK